jgi:hypothetical protein
MIKLVTDWTVRVWVQTGAKQSFVACLLFKTQRFGDWILPPFSDGAYSDEYKVIPIHETD